MSIELAFFLLGVVAGLTLFTLFIGFLCWMDTRKKLPQKLTEKDYDKLAKAIEKAEIKAAQKQQQKWEEN